MFLSGLISEALIVDGLFLWFPSGASNQVNHDELPRVKRNRGPKPKIMYDGMLKWLKVEMINVSTNFSLFVLFQVRYFCESLRDTVKIYSHDRQSYYNL